MMKLPVALLLGLALVAGGTKHVDVLATYVPAAKAGASPAVSVSLVPEKPDIRVNENPAPRLKLGPEQQVLVYDPPKAKAVPPVDPANARYLDPDVPVRFEVGLAEGVAKGSHRVPATITYFYCSKQKGWCRKGREQIELAVTVD